MQLVLLLPYLPRLAKLGLDHYQPLVISGDCVTQSFQQHTIHDIAPSRIQRIPALRSLFVRAESNTKGS